MMGSVLGTERRPPEKEEPECRSLKRRGGRRIRASTLLFCSPQFAKRIEPLAGLLDTRLQPFSSASTYAAINRSQATVASPGLPIASQSRPSRSGATGRGHAVRCQFSAISVIRALHRGGSASGSPLPLPITSLTSMRTTGERSTQVVRRSKPRGVQKCMKR